MGDFSLTPHHKRRRHVPYFRSVRWPDAASSTKRIEAASLGVVDVEPCGIISHSLRVHTSLEVGKFAVSRRSPTIGAPHQPGRHSFCIDIETRKAKVVVGREEEGMGA